MKLVSYEGEQKLNTVNGNVANTASAAAYGVDQQGLSNLSKAVGDLGNTMLQIQKQKEMTDVVNATNEFNAAMNDWMYNPDNGAMNRKGENALSIPIDYQLKVQELNKQIADKYNFKLKDSINAFNKIVDTDKTNTINNINKYVRGQYEDSALKALDLNVQSIANNGVVNGSQDAFEQTMHQLSGSIKAQLTNLGYDENTIDVQVKKAQQNTAVTMIEKKIADDDLDGANKMINAAASSGLIDEDKIMGYRQKVKKASVVLATSDDAAIDEAIGQFDPHDPNLLDKVTKALFDKGFGKVAGAMGEPTVENLKAAVMGQESGGDAGAVNARTGAYGLFQILPDNWPEWSAQAGIPGADMSDPEAQKKVAAFKLGEYAQKYGVEGAIVAWYAGPANGQRWKDGAPDAIDGNGNHYSWDAPQGNGDEPSIRQYMQDVKARLFNGGQPQEETAAQAQQRKELIQRNVATRIQNLRRKEAQTVENQRAEVAEKVAAVVANGGTEADVLKVKQDYAATHSEYARAEQDNLNRMQLSVNKAAQNAMKAKENNVLGVKAAIANGQFKSQGELTSFLGEMGVYFTPVQLKQIDDYYASYANGTGDFAPNMKGMKSTIESIAGRKIDGVEYQGVATAVYPKVQEYRNKYGTDPSPAQMAEWGADAVSQQAIASTKTGEFWGAGRMSNFFGGKGAAVTYTNAQLAANGMYGLYNTTGDDGEPYYVYKDSSGQEHTITPEELAERLGQ
nr:MAG TPA: hypothetical protein [Caudoviricetes sp.]